MDESIQLFMAVTGGSAAEAEQYLAVCTLIFLLIFIHSLKKFILLDCNQIVII